jgi:hypothetical protein
MKYIVEAFIWDDEFTCDVNSPEDLLEYMRHAASEICVEARRVRESENENEGGYEPVDNEVVYLILKDISWKSEDHEIESDDARLAESE